MEGRGWKAEAVAGGAGAGETGLLALLVGPVEVAGHYLEDLEALDVAAVEGQEVEEVVGDDLPGRVSFLPSVSSTN